MAGFSVLAGPMFAGFDAVPPQAIDPPVVPRDFDSERTTQGFLFEATRQVQLRSRGALHQYEFAGLGGLTLDLEKAVAVAHSDVPERALPDLLLGPGLLLPLAARAVFALHASAVRADGRVFLFCGPSGRGKSTLARLAEFCGAEALTDDVSPWRLAPEPVLLPRFPQLKWPQPLRVPDLALAIDGVVFVERDAAPMTLHPMAAAEARLCLIRDTVAARLMPASLLAAQLDAVTRLVQSLPMWRLNWPDCDVVSQPSQAGRVLAELSMR